jgi:flagellar biosynthesis GTPase FlhF
MQKSPAAAKPKPETEATAPATDNITVEATESKPPPYSPPNVYIAVMGQTGTGKTTFISDATGMKLKIGHELDSCAWLYSHNAIVP